MNLNVVEEPRLLYNRRDAARQLSIGIVGPPPNSPNPTPGHLLPRAGHPNWHPPWPSVPRALSCAKYHHKYHRRKAIHGQSLDAVVTC